jgi:dUTP pyrophosphatase
VVVLNSPGTIDADYRGEIGVIMMNFGDKLFPIRRGDRIAQLVVSRVERVSLYVADSWDTTERGTGGFGSTGTNSLDVA